MSNQSIRRFREAKALRGRPDLLPEDLLIRTTINNNGNKAEPVKCRPLYKIIIPGFVPVDNESGVFFLFIYLFISPPGHFLTFF